MCPHSISLSFNWRFGPHPSKRIIYQARVVIVTSQNFWEPSARTILWVSSGFKILWQSITETWLGCQPCAAPQGAPSAWSHYAEACHYQLPVWSSARGLRNLWQVPGIEERGEVSTPWGNVLMNLERHHHGDQDYPQSWCSRSFCYISLSSDWWLVTLKFTPSLAEPVWIVSKLASQKESDDRKGGLRIISNLAKLIIIRITLAKWIMMLATLSARMKQLASLIRKSFTRRIILPR